MTQSTNTAIRPLTFSNALLYFGIPALTLLISSQLIFPWLARFELTDFERFALTNTIPLAFMFTAAAVAFTKEETLEPTWQRLRTRYRYPTLRWKDLGLGIAIFIGGMIGYGLLQPLTMALIDSGWIQLPATIPAIIDPRNPLSIDILDQFAGGSIRGNWSVAVIYFIMLFFNIAGEELWWRGYILPRQEAQHGRYAWLIHGLMWNLFHIFKWWDLINLLPICLLISYIAQRTQNNWAAFIAHYLFNGIGFLGILAAIAGWI